MARIRAHAGVAQTGNLPVGHLVEYRPGLVQGGRARTILAVALRSLETLAKNEALAQSGNHKVLRVFWMNARHLRRTRSMVAVPDVAGQQVDETDSSNTALVERPGRSRRCCRP
jgi:hypothetical protein